MGKYDKLLPIVVICAHKEDAEAIDLLNDDIFDVVESRDAHLLAYLAQNRPVTLSDNKIYAIRHAVETPEKGMTGIWVGFHWFAFLACLDKDKCTWCKPKTLSEALVFMLSKTGYNFPLLTDKQPIPPPPAASTTASPPRAERAAPARSAPATPVRPSRPPAASCTAPRISAPANDDDETLSLHTLAVGLDLHDNIQPLEIQLLQQIIRPIPGMVPSDNRLTDLPISFGAEADGMLRAKGVRPEDLLKILQMRVRATNHEAFALHMNLVLGWQGWDALSLWKAMKFPSL
ncbi:hypothetical protein C8Q76DRAFT_792174 [Earliella scabrosa]|nr:hypothetical protein C8Q76DRAFT_792174 [Earliella scabrosa]